MAKPSTKRRPTKASVKAKADRAEARAKGEPVDATPEPTPLDPPEVHPGGRPTLYKPEFANIAKEMCRLGATDGDLAAAFNVTTVTIWNWRCNHVEFFNALTVGKSEADDVVERSLFQRAAGYSYNTEKIFCSQGEVTKVQTVEHIPPDVGAAMNWLSNRKPDTWRMKQSLEVGGKNGGPVEITLTPFERARRLALLFEQAAAETGKDGGPS